jgi:hypothetical protein
VLLDLFDDEEKFIQRRIDYLRALPTNADPGRFGRVEGEPNPAGHAPHVLLIEPIAYDEIGIEAYHHITQLFGLDGLHLHVGTEDPDGCRKGAPIGAERVLEGDYYLDIGRFFMSWQDGSIRVLVGESTEADQGYRACCHIRDTA